ncbi:hypothetical protein [Lichenibacterium dinghuense]|uniref:hypothetical protein n=1 Tax=Lichenibacterium dinghuense TaxID=2895977 RepID=UPI001F49099B|nr:hypothetical protein [Lichenibacterium sp. 6Y81]
MTIEGQPEEHSLTVRAWQRAGALARLFGPDGDSALRPQVVYASTVGPGTRDATDQERLMTFCETLSGNPLGQ